LDPIELFEILETFLHNQVELISIAKNGFRYSSQKGGEIIIEIPSFSDFDFNHNVRTIKIYIRNDAVIERLFTNLYYLLRQKRFEELPMILGFTQEYDDDLEKLYRVFNYLEETPVIDFKREINYKKNHKNQLEKVQKEIIKDIIALGNSAYLYDNSAYFVIGLDEDCGEYKNIYDIRNQEVLFQRIVYLCRRFISSHYNLSHLTISFKELYDLIKEGKVVKNIPFSSKPSTTTKQNIMVIHIKRDSKECLELKKKIIWKSKKGVKTIPRGMSWIRIGSHTFEISNEERKKLYTI